MATDGSAYGRASGQGRVYQSTGSQFISEHHHHYATVDEGSLFAPHGGDAGGAGGAADRRSKAASAGPGSVRVPLVGRRPRVLRDRHELLETLLAGLCRETGGIHVLHGLGGIGKTAIAQAAFEEGTRDGGRIGLWVNASEPMTLRAGMLAVAADRGAESGELVAAHGGQRAPADLVWHYLNASAQEWILVLDNADDPDLLHQSAWLRSSSRGTVLVTTRHADPSAWEGAVLHGVDLLPVDDAAQVLRDLAPQAARDGDAESVARRLGCLPLALTLAGSFLSHQLLESWSMSDYENHLEDNPTELIDQGALRGRPGRDDRHLVSRTWEISLETLTEQGLPECSVLLGLMSCWGADPLPLHVLRPDAVDSTDLGNLTTPLTGASLEAALRGLLDHSLTAMVTVDTTDGPVRCLQTHGVLLDSVASRIPAEWRQSLIDAAIMLLTMELDGQNGQGSHGTPGLLVPHAAGLLRRLTEPNGAEEAVGLTVRLVHELYESGDYPSTLALATDATHAGARLLGNESALTLRASQYVGKALFRLGRFEESEARERQVLEARERLFGPDHPDTLESRHDLYEPLPVLQRVDEAVTELRRAVEGRTRTLGACHADTLHSRAALVELLGLSRRTEEFDRLGPSVIADSERFLGADHITTLNARHNFAYGLYLTDRLDDAEAVARKALADRDRVQGAEHPLTLSAVLLLSWIMRGRGELGEAVALGRRVVAGQERVLGREHPWLLANRAGLASTLAEAGFVDEARSMAAEDLPICERILGTDDSVSAQCREILGDSF